MAAPAKLTAQQYFAIDDASDIKHELVDGELWAMAGSSPEHALLTATTTRSVGNHLHGDCRIYSSNLRVAVTYQTFAYPDATIVCGPIETTTDSDRTVTNPTVVFEVLSPTTELYDRGMKRILYSRVESMKAVVLISQDQPLVEVYERQNGDWFWRTYEGLDAVARIAPLDVVMPLAELYSGVEFA